MPIRGFYTICCLTITPVLLRPVNILCSPDRFPIPAKLRFLCCFNAIRDLDDLARGGIGIGERPGFDEFHEPSRATMCAA
jgi:hypothetical protein